MSPLLEKPILHGRDHACGGADPLPGICDLFPVAGTIDEAILATAPGAYYKLDETGSTGWADSSPGNRDASYTARTGTVRGVASGLDEGDGSLCVTVDGGAPSTGHAASYVGSANISDGWFDFSGVVPFSVTARIRPTTVSVGTQRRGICGVSAAVDDDGWCLNIDGVGGGTQNRVRFCRGGITSSHSSNPYSPTVLTIDEWVRVTATYDGTTSRLYLDSTHVASAANSHSLPSGAGYQTFYIGAAGDGSTNLWAPFTGDVDSIAVWDRALDPSEVGGIAAFEDPTYTTSAGYVLTADGLGGVSYQAPTIEVTY